MTLPRRVPPEPSAAAIEAALAKVDFGRPVSPMHLDSMEDSVIEALRAAYAVEAPRGVPVTVERIEALLNEMYFGATHPEDMTVHDEACWLVAHLVPPEAP